MITKSKAYVTTDGQLFATREEAQRYEAEHLFKDIPTDSACPWTLAVDVVLNHKAEFLAILSDRKPRTPKPPKAAKKKTAPTAQPPTA